jgi:hypothetical protein
MRQPNSSSVQYHRQQGTDRYNSSNQDIKASADIDSHRNIYIYIYIYIYVYREPVQRKAQKKTFSSRVQFPTDVQKKKH